MTGHAPKAEFRAPGIIRVQREGRMLSVLTNQREELLAEARGLSPESIDVAPVTLKEIFLESVRTED